MNPLALEELSELGERHQFLESQVEDVRGARRELHQVIRTLDEEIMHVFDSAFADVNEHFSTLVTSLFPGGTGRLSLTDPENLLDTGVEVEVRPAGRNVRRLSLLSGGERSLVALAFLFAVFRSRPSPFYLMDEVEAALDDVNLQRFLGLVHEFREEAQLIIVSHQKRTMEAADALYGVTMAPGGSSKVVSQKVPRHRSDGRTVGRQTGASPGTGSGGSAGSGADTWGCGRGSGQRRRRQRRRRQPGPGFRDHGRGRLRRGRHRRSPGRHPCGPRDRARGAAGGHGRRRARNRPGRRRKLEPEAGSSRDREASPDAGPRPSVSVSIAGKAGVRPNTESARSRAVTAQFGAPRWPRATGQTAGA